jgi:hypothetical protein
MRRLKAVLVSACVAASVSIVVTPSPALACDKYPCKPACRWLPGTQVNEDGTVTTDGRLVECYY